MKSFGLPAIAGIGLGISLTRPPEKSTPPEASQPPHPDSKTETRLPDDDPAVLKIATIAGRGTEARKKLQELLAADAKDEEIAGWLALVLFSDPSWLDSFILTVPEDRRIGLARLTLLKVGKLQDDAVWELIRASPYARQAALSDVEIEHRKGLDILGYCRGSPLAAETLLDPSFGFSDKEIHQSLRFCYGHENAQAIVEAWVRGRWKDDPPQFVRGSWLDYRSTHQNDLAEITKTFPAEIRSATAEFDTYWEQNKQIQSTPVGKTPTLEELAALNQQGLNDAFDFQRESGSHIPLATLVQLPAELRKSALENYFSQSDTFHPDMIRNSISEADQINLTPGEKGALLQSGALLIWTNEGDYETALDWAGRIPDITAREKCEEQLLTKLANTDPDPALNYISRLQPGGLRDKIEKIATEAQP